MLFVNSNKVSFRKLLFLLCLLIAVMVLNSCSADLYNTKPVTDEDVFVEMGKPRDWTLDEAHYLIAGLNERARNLAVEGDLQLEPNTFNSSRLQTIRTATEVKAEYDQAAALKNSIALQDYETDKALAAQAQTDIVTYNAEREKLRSKQVAAKINVARTTAEETAQQARLDRLIKQSQELESRHTSLLSEISQKDLAGEDTSKLEAEREKIRQEADSVKTELSLQEDELGATQAKKATALATEAEINARLSQLDTDIAAAKDLTDVSAPTTVSATTADDVKGGLSDATVVNDFTKNVTDALNKETNPRGGFVPSFNVSDKLGNYVRAEYELLSRQLTMLRSEAGPDKSVVFLELPYSVHTARRASKWRHVQLHWQVAGVCTKDPIREFEEGLDVLLEENKREVLKKVFAAVGLQGAVSDESLNKISEEQKAIVKLLEEIDSVKLMTEEDITKFMKKKEKLAKTAVPEKLLSEGNMAGLQKWQSGTKDNMKFKLFWEKNGIALSDKTSNKINKLKEDLISDLPYSLEKASRRLEKDFKTFVAQREKNKEIDSTQINFSKGCQGKTLKKCAMDRNEDRLKASQKSAKEGLRSDLKSLVSQYTNALKYELLKNGLETLFTDEDLETKMCNGTEAKQAEASQKKPEHHPVVVRELSPSANAYNRADFLLEENNVGVAGKLGLLFGLGINASFERQKQVFEQFASQHVYASAYGNGQYKFGWVIGPKPGSREIRSAAENTYAVMTLPKNATAVKFKARACILDNRKTVRRNLIRSKNDKPENNKSKENNKNGADGVSHHCFSVKEFTSTVKPNWRLYVEEIHYTQALSGDANSVLIKGRDFSSHQISILVDGHPIERYLGAGDQASRILSAVDARTLTTPTGYFEVTNRETLVLNIKTPADYEGTPEITLISPRRSLQVNSLNVKMSLAGGDISSMRKQKKNPMFVKALKFDSDAVVSREVVDNTQQVILKGEGFEQGMTVHAISKNGKIKDLSYGQYKILSTNALKVELDAEGPWTVVLGKPVRGRQTSTSIDISAPPKSPKPPAAIQAVNLVGLQSSSTTDQQSHIDVTLHVKGTNLPDCLKVTLPINNLTAGFMPNEAAQKCQNNSQVSNSENTLKIRRMTKTDIMIEARLNKDTREEVLILQDNKDDKAKPLQSVIKLPSPPVLKRIYNLALSSIQANPQDPSLLACGRETGGEQIIIEGHNLDQVKQLRFGTQLAQVLWSSSSKMSIVPPPGKGQVLVTATTDPKNILPSGRGVGGGLMFSYSKTGCQKNMRALQ